MMKKEQDKIEYAFKKVSIFLSPDRASFDLFIQNIISMKKNEPIKSPYTNKNWFSKNKFLILKVTPVTIVAIIAVFVGTPEISKTRTSGIANDIINEIENETLIFSTTNEEDALLKEIENSTFDDLAKISFYEE